MSQQPVPDWFRPLWVRVLTTVLPGVWAVVEAVNQQWMWAALFGGLAAFGLWKHIITFDQDGPKT